METLWWQVEQLPGLLALSRSGLVRDWDPPTLDRALQWGRYFQHLHGRFRAQPRLRAALGQRLRRGQQPGPPPPLSFGHLGRCPELLGLALLGNRALPPAACHRLLRSLLLPPPPPPEGQATPGPCSFGLLARRRAAARVLLPPPLLPPSSAAESSEELEPPLRVRTEAQLLLSRLREEEEEGPGSPRAAGEQPLWLSGVLQQLPRPRVYRVLAALLLEQSGDSAAAEGASWAENREAAGAVLSWLLGDPGRLSAFCRLLPGSLLAALAAQYAQLGTPYLHLLSGWGSRLRYDPLRGQWASSHCPSEDELSWEELRERFSCFMRGPARLREAALAALKNLKTQDGDFEVSGLSVWTDLLLEMEAPH